MVVTTVAVAGWALAAVPSAWAQVPPSVSGFPAAVWGPVSTASELPPQLQITSVYLPPVTPGQQAAVAVGFAGPFQSPEDRWRVSVGIGDPNGIWVRSTMEWDGTVASGSAVRLDGALATDLGPVAVNVQTAGLVVIDLPEAVDDGSLADTMWVEGVLGPDSAPDATMRSDWFPRSAVFGQGAPGQVTGGRFGTVLGDAPAAVGTGPDPVVADTGVPSVVRVTDDLAIVELGTPPTDVTGQPVAEVVDVVTFSTDPVGPPTGPQVRVNRTTGLVDLTVGNLGGPVSLSDFGAPVVAADPSWLPSGSSGPADGSAPPQDSLTVDLAAAFSQVGLAPPGDALAVSVTRVVSAADGTQVVSAGMAADRTWLDQGVAVAPVITVAPIAEAEGESGPWALIVAGVVVGLVAVGGSMALASAMARRRTGSDWVGGSDAGGVGDVLTVDQPAPSSQPAWGVETWGERTTAEPDTGDTRGVAHDEAARDAAARDTAVAGDAPASPLASLDDDIEELSRRLRRLDGDGDHPGATT
jgi:hypothetical protein